MCGLQDLPSLRYARNSRLSALPQKLFKHHPLRREAVAAVTAESKPYLLRLWSSLGVVLLD